MDKSKIKSIRKQVRKADLPNEKRIYERNSDTGEIKSRKKGDYGNERIEETPTDTNGVAYDMQHRVIYDMQHRVRKEVLNELWHANKVNHEGHWYIKLTDVVSIIGDDNELYENESKS